MVLKVGCFVFQLLSGAHIDGAGVRGAITAMRSHATAVAQYAERHHMDIKDVQLVDGPPKSQRSSGRSQGPALAPAPVQQPQAPAVLTNVPSRPATAARARQRRAYVSYCGASYAELLERVLERETAEQLRRAKLSEIARLTGDEAQKGSLRARAKHALLLRATEGAVLVVDVLGAYDVGAYVRGDWIIGDEHVAAKDIIPHPATSPTRRSMLADPSAILRQTSLSTMQAHGEYTLEERLEARDVLEERVRDKLKPLWQQIEA